MSSRQPSLFDRIERDIERGDYALARDRLTSHVSQKGYDSELVARLGQICFAMHDHFLAGRYWLVSREDGPDVDRAVAEFLRRCKDDPKHRVAQLPAFCRVRGFEEYPAFIQARLQALGIEMAILLPKTEATKRSSSGFNIPDSVWFAVVAVI